MAKNKKPAAAAKKSSVIWVVSTHWDREWYEPFQGFRYRLVHLLDEALDVMQRDGRFTHFQMDGQSIPIEDYLEIRPEREAEIRELARDRRLAIGPWYVLPDEFIVGAESFVRNLRLGLEVAARFGEPSRAGFICDIFGHNSQMPQIFQGFGINVAFVWRGALEHDTGRNFRWRSPDGSEVLAYRFGPKFGYCDYGIKLRSPSDASKPYDPVATLAETGQYILAQDRRPPAGVPTLVFDGVDHLEIEPLVTETIARLRKGSIGRKYDVRLGTLDDYARELEKHRPAIRKVITGELRRPAERLGDEDQVWLIPGVLSSRIHLKQANARCESILTQWAEPFGAFAVESGLAYPAGFLRAAWRSLLANHAHDSICGCSPDQIHKDMEFRFDQAELIGERLKAAALDHIARGVARGIVASSKADDCPDDVIVLANPTARDIDEPVDFTVVVPHDAPAFNEFFGFESKPGFWLHDAQGKAIAYQRTAQRFDQIERHWTRYKLVNTPRVHAVDVTARVKIPAYGYTTLTVRREGKPTRHGGSSLATGHASAENEFLAIDINGHGLLDVIDKRTGEVYPNLLALENCADIGDGWYHGIALNDEVFHSGAASANVVKLLDGPERATFKIELEWSLPAEFDFKAMRRSAERRGLRVEHLITLRRGCPRIEVSTSVDNNLRDHRLRVLFPSGIATDHYWADSPFDAIKRPIGLDPRNHAFKELEVETTPQQSWTALLAGGRGLAVISKGLPESTVCDLADRPIALTLFRAFRRTVMTTGEPGGQLQRRLDFNYWIVPLQPTSGYADPDAAPDVVELARHGQQLAAGIGQAHFDLRRPIVGGEYYPQAGYPAAVDGTQVRLPRQHGFLRLDGPAVISAIERDANGALLVRLFNPAPEAAEVTLGRPGGIGRAWRCDLELHLQEELPLQKKNLRLSIPSRRIQTVKLS